MANKFCKKKNWSRLTLKNKYVHTTCTNIFPFSASYTKMRKYITVTLTENKMSDVKGLTKRYVFIWASLSITLHRFAKSLSWQQNRWDLFARSINPTHPIIQLSCYHNHRSCLSAAPLRIASVITLWKPPHKASIWKYLSIFMTMNTRPTVIKMGLY